LVIIIGIKKGLTLLGPFDNKTECSCSITSRPPIPVPVIQAILDKSSLDKSSLESSIAIFEATHGTAPDIAGKNVVNPCSNLLSGVMMLEHIGWNDAAELIYSALGRSFADGYATYDLARLMSNGKALSTSDFVKHLIKLI